MHDFAFKTAPVPFAEDTLDSVIAKATQALLQKQAADGSWAYELEADVTIPAEYILLGHFLGSINQPLYERIAEYIRATQEDHGGWPLFPKGALDISASVKAYFALKCVGDDPEAPHMKRAREAILTQGGAAKSNVFTRIQMALFGAVPWKAVPVMPVEIVLLPRWFPFHLEKVSYWSRTVIVPLLVLMAKKPRARNPQGIRIDELFTVPPAQVKQWHSNATRSIWNPVFRGIDAVLRALEPLIPNALRGKAIVRAVAWVEERLNGEDGLGGIYPAMANSLMMFDTLGYPPGHDSFVTARGAVDRLVIDEPGRSYCQPCLSPVWDTALAAHALLEAGADPQAIGKACEWLKDKQILDVMGDWASRRPGLRPAAGPFSTTTPITPMSTTPPWW